jgi:hypothetical protein
MPRIPPAKKQQFDRDPSQPQSPEDQHAPRLRQRRAE